MSQLRQKDPHENQLLTGLNVCAPPTWNIGCYLSFHQPMRLREVGLSLKMGENFLSLDSQA